MKTISDNIKAILAIVGAVGSIAYLFYVTMATDDNTIRSQALIAVVAIGTSVMNYYFGYSQGAASKDQTMTDTVNKLTDKVK